MDIIVTIFSAFYIIIEEKEFKYRHRLVGRYIVQQINKRKEDEFKMLNKAYKEAEEDHKRL